MVCNKFIWLLGLSRLIYIHISEEGERGRGMEHYLSRSIPSFSLVVYAL